MHNTNNHQMRKIDFGLGYSNTPLHKNINQEIISNIQNIQPYNDDKNLSHIYTNTSGLDILKTAIIKKLLTSHKKQYQLNELIICNGARAAIFNYLLAIKNMHSNKSIQAHLIIPYWHTYKSILQILNITYQEHTKIENIQLNDDNINIICLINPGNPDGKICSYNELSYLVNLMNLQKNTYVISDEVYSDIIFDNQKHLSIASMCNQDLQQQFIVINSFSKTNEISGWRIGYGISHHTVIKEMNNIQKATCANVSNLSQYAALAAINNEHLYLTNNIASYEAKRNLIIEKLNKYFTIYKPQAGLFILIGLPNNINCDKFCDFMLNKYNVTILSGNLFKIPNVFRLCFARNKHDLIEGCERLIDAIQQFKTKKNLTIIK
ncbi:MAG: pyridoxal phosphate-dependent aminotransferase [Pseudomonadota bacterium]